MNQPALFDAAKTTSQACAVPHCGAILLPGQDPPLLTCAHDLDREHGRTRPKGCLNRIDNAHQEIPY